MDGTSATDESPVVQFSAAGTYDVQLIITSTSYADTVAIDDYITIVPFTGNTTILTEGFQSENLFRQSDWELYNEEDGWLMTTNYGGYGLSAGSIVALSYDQLEGEVIEIGIAYRFVQWPTAYGVLYGLCLRITYRRKP